MAIRPSFPSLTGRGGVLFAPLSLVPGNVRELKCSPKRSTINRRLNRGHRTIVRTKTLAEKNYLLFALAGIACFGSALTVQAAPGAGVTLDGVQPKTLSILQMAAADKTATHGVVSADRKTLMFRQKTVRLVVHSGPANDMLSYRIVGLRNPTLVVPARATLKTLFINTDDDMTHNLRFGAQRGASAPSVGTLGLAHKTGTAFHAADMTLRAPPKPGAYYYFCTVPGHAQGGMRGTLRVR